MLKNALKMLFCVRSPFPLEGPPAHICAARFSVKCGSRQSVGANVYCNGTPGIPLSFCIIALHLPPLISGKVPPTLEICGRQAGCVRGCYALFDLWLHLMGCLKIFWERDRSIRLLKSSPSAFKARGSITFLESREFCGVWGLIHSRLRSVPS